MPELSTFDRFKIQAEVLVPILHELEKDLGKVAALNLLRSAMSEMFTSLTREFVENVGESRATKIMWRGIGEKEQWELRNPISIHVRKVDEEVAEIDVVDCQYAEFFTAIGEPELGFLLACSADHDIIGATPNIELQRTQTKMQGATHCDFRYRLKSPPKINDEQISADPTTL